MSPLKSIVYVSTARVATTEPMLEKLLTDARRLNEASGITGVLLCSEINFMQCFEGTPAAVDATWRRIRQSSLHGHIIELLNADIDERSFTDFQMGLGRCSESDILSLSTARWQSRAKSERRTESVGFELLKQFWGNAR